MAGHALFVDLDVHKRTISVAMVVLSETLNPNILDDAVRQGIGIAAILPTCGLSVANCQFWRKIVR